MGQGKVTSNTIYPQNIAQNSQDLLKNCNTLHRSSSSIAFYSNSKGNGETTKEKCTNTQLRAISDSLERKSHIIPPQPRAYNPVLLMWFIILRDQWTVDLTFEMVISVGGLRWTTRPFGLVAGLDVGIVISPIASFVIDWLSGDRCRLHPRCVC